MKFERVTGRNFLSTMHCCHEDFFILANSADPNEIPQHAAFHLGLHRLQMSPFAGIQNEKDQ